MYDFISDTFFYQGDKSNFNKITDADKDEGIHVAMHHINV